MFLSGHAEMNVQLATDIRDNIPGVDVAVGKSSDDAVTDELIETSAQALFVLHSGCLRDPGYSRDLASAIDCLGLDAVILAFLGPAVGGVEFDVICRECPYELKERGLLSKLAFEWHTGQGFQQVCLHKVAVCLGSGTESASHPCTPGDDDDDDAMMRTNSADSLHSDHDIPVAESVTVPVMGGWSMSKCDPVLETAGVEIEVDDWPFEDNGAYPFDSDPGMDVGVCREPVSHQEVSAHASPLALQRTSSQLVADDLDIDRASARDAINQGVISEASSPLFSYQEVSDRPCDSLEADPGMPNPPEYELEADPGTVIWASPTSIETVI